MENSLYVSLSLKLVFCRQHIYGSCFCIHSASLCLLVGEFNPFTFKVIMDIYVPKVRLVKAMVFPVVMYGYENWTVKKAEQQRIDAFELWCWRRLLRVPWT